MDSQREQDIIEESSSIRKEIDSINKSNNAQQKSIEELQTTFEKSSKISLDMQSSFKERTDQLDSEVSKFSESIEKNVKQKQPFVLANFQQTQNKQALNVVSKKEDQAKFQNGQKWFNEFNFDGKTLKKVNDGWFKFVLFEQVSFEKQLRFQIKIVKSKYNHIFIGVCDYEKQKESLNPNSSQNAISYCAFGHKYPGVLKVGFGFKVGDTVEIIVNRNTKTIKWITNKLKRAQWNDDILGDKDRKLFPYVVMYYKQSTIEFVRL